MIIAVVCDVLGEENNGTTVVAMNLIRYLKTKGHTVRVVCPDKSKEGELDYFIANNMNFGKTLNKYVNKVGVTIAKPSEEILTKALEGVDAVHIMVPLPLGLMACKIAKKMKLPISAGFHMQAENLTSYFKLNFKPITKAVYKFIYKHLYRYVDAIHYPTEFIKNVFECNIKTKTPAYVISNGVHGYVCSKQVEKPKEFKDKIVILSTGRYAREKSQDTLLKAIKYSKYKDKIQIILAGQGLKEKYYKKLASKLPVKPIFNFYSRNEIIDVLNMCDIYVHPADIELEGIACLEAIACGKLTIVSDSKLSATKDFAVDNCCIFKRRNPKSLAKTIDYFIDNPQEKARCEQLYKNCKKVYNQEDCMVEMEKMIYDCVNKHKKDCD